MQDLSGKVPVIERLACLDSLIALQADQLRTRHGRPRLRERCLTGSGFTLEQQRSIHSRGEKDDCRQPLTWKVAGTAQRIADRGRTDGGCAQHGSLVPPFISCALSPSTSSGRRLSKGVFT